MVPFLFLGSTLFILASLAIVPAIYALADLWLVRRPRDAVTRPF